MKYIADFIDIFKIFFFCFFFPHFHSTYFHSKRIFHLFIHMNIIIVIRHMNTCIENIIKQTHKKQEEQQNQQ